MKSAAASPGTWRQGAFLTACNLLVGLGQYGFQTLLGRGLPLGEYGRANACLSFALLLALPATVAGNTLLHFLSRLREGGREDAVRALVASSGRGLLALMAVAAVLGLSAPGLLSRWSGFARESLFLTALVCLAVNLWTVWTHALCAGMGWFRTLGVLGVGAVVIRVGVGGWLTAAFARAEIVAGALAAAALLNVVPLCRRGFRLRPAGAAGGFSLWNREGGGFLLAALVSALASFGFTQSDMLLAQHDLVAADAGRFCAAGVFARALIGVAGSVLVVFFAGRSARAGSPGTPADRHREVKLIVLYLALVAGGAVVLAVAAVPLTTALLGRPEPLAAALLGRFAGLMVLVAGIEVVGYWALADRRWGMLGLHGVLSAGYVTGGLLWGRGATELMTALLVGAAVSLGVLLAAAFARRRVMPTFRPPGDQAAPTLAASAPCCP